MSLYTLPLNVLIQIFTYSTKRDRNKHLALVCHRFWMIRKKHFVNVAFHSDLHRKWKQGKGHLRPPKLVLVVNVMKQPSRSSRTANSICLVKSIGKFCKKFARKKVTILVKTPYFLHYQQHYYSENHSPKIRTKLVNLICKLKNAFDTPGANCRFVRKFNRIEGCFNHELCNISFYQGISFNTCNL